MNKKIMPDSTCSYAEKYHIAANEYADVKISTLNLSVRVINRLIRAGIDTLEALLRVSPETLLSLKGFGRTCLVEVDKLCSAIEASTLPERLTMSGNSTPASLKPYAKCIASGDFSFARDLELSEHERIAIERFQESFQALGSGLASACVTCPDVIIPIVQALEEFQGISVRYSQMREMLAQLPRERQKSKAIPYINVFTLNDLDRHRLQEMCSSEDGTIEQMVYSSKIADNTCFLLLKRFLSWCNFDLCAETEQLLSSIYTDNRIETIVKGRAQKQTLEQLGKNFEITRERVRQIEAKAKRKFARLQSRIRIVEKIAAERDGVAIISPTEIETYLGKDVNDLLYLLKENETADYIYDCQLNVFVLGDISLSERIQTHLESLPEIIKKDNLDDLFEELCTDGDLPREMLSKAFFESYRLTGDVYHRCRLSLAKIYQKTLKAYYEDGIQVYNPVEIAQFRDHVRADFGDVNLPTNDRALTARIASICILRGRGIYMPKRDHYVPKALANRIRDYILTSDAPIILTNTLFHVFEEELLAAGIDNKYYLQGVLHELFENEFCFRRDYISRDGNTSSIYSSIVNFIRGFQFPVSKAQIRAKFPGITDVVVNFAIDDDSVLNYYGQYFHASRLVISNSERECLFNLLGTALQDNNAHHIKELYPTISQNYSEVLTRNAALNSFSTYSLLEYLFRENFQFSRPYIAPFGSAIDHPGERLHSLIYSTDSFAILDISDFAKENYFQIPSLIEFVNSCNDKYLFADRETIMRIDRIGVTPDLAKQVDSLIADRIHETTPIESLEIWNALPDINVPWSDWLIYSVLHKWGHRTSVGTSAGQLKYAVPLVAPAGTLDVSNFRGLIASDRATNIQVDNLDDIDNLLESIIGSEFLEGDL